MTRLPKVGFVEETDGDAFGFLDPDLVIHGSHLIPDFNLGRTQVLMPYNEPTVAQPLDQKDDWTNFYVNMCDNFQLDPIIITTVLTPPQFCRSRHVYEVSWGGGIGHLEQFPPADHNHEDSTMSDSGDVEIEIDDFIEGDNDGSDNTSSDDEGSGDEGEEDEDEEDDETGVHNEWYDPGELSDKETGNVY